MKTIIFNFKNETLYKTFYDELVVTFRDSIKKDKSFGNIVESDTIVKLIVNKFPK